MKVTGMIYVNFCSEMLSTVKYISPMAKPFILICQGHSGAIHGIIKSTRQVCTSNIQHTCHLVRRSRLGRTFLKYTSH